MKSKTTTESPDSAIGDPSKVFRSLIEEAGEDPDREGLEETWKRRAPEMWSTITEGYDKENKPDMTSFPVEHEGMVVKKDIPFYSLCEHHLLPFSGKVHIGYVPNGEIVGLSKLIRYTRWKARKLTVQERLTREITEGISEEVGAEGVIVAIEAEHTCEAMRGIETPDTTTITTFSTGVLDEENRRKEFFDQAGV